MKQTAKKQPWHKFGKSSGRRRSNPRPVSGLVTSFMSAKHEPSAFVDTNVLVYAFAPEDVSKSPKAQMLVERLMEAKTLQTSTQVLQEFFVTVTRKLDHLVSPRRALHYVEQIAQYAVIVLDSQAVMDAMEVSIRDQLALWDALIIVAAARSRARILYTEDLQHGREILGVKIVNPFHTVNN